VAARRNDVSQMPDVHVLQAEALGRAEAGCAVALLRARQLDLALAGPHLGRPAGTPCREGGHAVKRFDDLVVLIEPHQQPAAESGEGVHGATGAIGDDRSPTGIESDIGESIAEL